MTFRAEPYGVFVDDLVSALTGGITRDGFTFAAENEPYQLGSRGAVAATVRIHGLSGDRYRRFTNGVDFRVDDLGVITWMSAAPGIPGADATWPDPGTTFWAGYERRPDPAAPPILTDRNPGSVVRTLAESFAREYAVLSRQLEQVYEAAFVATASGRDLDAVVDLVGLTRRTALHARGEIVFSRATPAAGDVFIPAGTRISTADAPAVVVETTGDTTLRRGTLSAAAPAQALAEGGAGVAPAETLTVLHRPINGVQRVTNPEPLAFASAAETDEALRSRARRALDHAGRSTAGAIIGALTSVEGIREQDVRVDEDHVAHPGVVKVTVAAELPAARAAQAAAALEDARPAGIRFLHNLPVAPLPATVVGPGGGARPGPLAPPAVTDPIWFAVGVTAVVTPADADLAASQKAALTAEVEAAITAFVGALGAGEAVVYNRLVVAVLAVEGAYDVVIDLYPAGAPPAGRQNLFPDPPTTRPRLDHLDVSIRGALVALDVRVSVERRGLAAALDPKTALANARDTISTQLAHGLPGLLTSTVAPELPRIRPEALRGVLADTEDFVVEELHYTAEFLDEGLRVVSADRAFTPTPDEQPWLRSVVVVEGTQS